GQAVDDRRTVCRDQGGDRRLCDPRGEIHARSGRADQALPADPRRRMGHRVRSSPARRTRARLSTATTTATTRLRRALRPTKKARAMRAFSFCGRTENLRAVADPRAELADHFRGLARPGEVPLPGPVRYHAGDLD